MTVVPRRTIEISSNLLSASFVPALKIGCFKKVLPSKIPKRIAIVAAPIVGNQMAITLLIAATKKDNNNPGRIFLLFDSYTSHFLFS